MSSSVLHHCHLCGYETEVSQSLAAFAENPHCRQCGLSASESSFKLQDDLSAQFSRCMTMASTPQVVDSQVVLQSAPPIVYSITQHYHHSSHQAVPQSQADQAADVTKQPQVSPEDLLMQHNIEPASLSSDRIALFEQASPEQRHRLIQLWQISSPEASRSTLGGLNGVPGFIRERLAGNGDVDMDQDEEQRDYSEEAEPYVVSGYESLSRRDYEMSAKQTEESPNSEPHVLGSLEGGRLSDSSRLTHANDPVYRGREWWQHGTLQPIEYQYGAFSQMRQYSY